MPRSRATVLVLALFPVLLAGKCTPDEPPIDDGPTDLTPPEVQLQVVSIDPAQGMTGIPFEAQVYGSEFQPGARVRLGNQSAARVEWRSENALDVSVPGMADGIYDVTVTNPDGDQAVLRRGLTVSGEGLGEACRRLTLYFAFDSADLAGASLGVLTQQSECLRSARGQIRLEGHCDERGTTEYNLSLGERRAFAVQRWLVGQGVSPARISAISYGEERPAVRGHDEAAWSQNRRVELSLKD